MNNIRRYSFPSTRYQHGLTLVEILVALVISMFLVTGVIQLFVGSKQTYRFHDALSRLQENGRLALDIMAADIRMAGYIASIPPPPPALLPQPPSPIVAVEAINNGVIVRWFDPGLAPYQCRPFTPTTGGICSRAYLIRPSTNPAPACPTAGTSLFLERDNAGPQELIEGVQAMQILYGVCNDTDGDGWMDVITPTGAPVGTFYVSAPNIAANDWPNVCSVRIHLLLVSLEDNVVTQPQPYFFPIDTAGPPTVPVDRCLRQAFSTTIAIRNRLWTP